MHGEYFAWILMVLVDDRVACQVADAHDAVGMIHTVFLYTVDSGVDMSA